MILFDPFPDGDCPEGVGPALEFMRHERNISPEKMAFWINEEAKQKLFPMVDCTAEEIIEMEKPQELLGILSERENFIYLTMVLLIERVRPIPNSQRMRIAPAALAVLRGSEFVKPAPAPIVAIEEKKHELAVRAHRGTAFSTFLTPTTQEMQFLAYNLKQIVTNSEGEQIRLPKCLQSNHHAIIHSNALHDLFTPGKSLASNEATTTLIEIVNTFADFLRDHHHMERETVDNFRRDGLALVELIDKAREATREEYRQWHNNPRIHTR